MSEYRTDEAFAIVPMWLIESKVSDRALRLYALLSGMRDYGTDMATVGRKLLASKLGCSDDTLDRAKAELEKAQAITVERGTTEDGQIARNIYTIHRVSPGSRNGAVRVAAPVRVGVAGAARLPLMDESSSSSSEGSKSAKPTARLPKTAGGTKVTEVEHDLVDAILAAFNRAAGVAKGRQVSFAGKEWREKIIRRVREHSDVTLEQHVEIIDQQFHRPWWKGDPTPSVIYGNGAVFDRALNGAQAGEPEEDRFTRD